MRATIVVTVVLSAFVTLASWSGAEPTPPKSLPPPLPASSYNAEHLRQQFVTLAGKRAERMSVAELKEGINEMRRQCLIAELTDFCNESWDVRTQFAAEVLKVKDEKALETLIRSWAKMLDEEKGATD